MNTSVACADVAVHLPHSALGALSQTHVNIYAHQDLDPTPPFVVGTGLSIFYSRVCMSKDLSYRVHIVRHIDTSIFQHVEVMIRTISQYGAHHRGNASVFSLLQRSSVQECKLAHLACERRLGVRVTEISVPSSTE
jgi:hypothetical protein